VVDQTDHSYSLANIGARLPSREFGGDHEISDYRQRRSGAAGGGSVCSGLRFIAGPCTGQTKSGKQAGCRPASPGRQTTTSKITFHTRPSGAKITLDSGRSCIAPCSMIVGFNEKFTAVATKPGYQSKEILVSPSLTDVGKA